MAQQVQRAIAFDLEGVLFPEIWPHLAEVYGISSLRVTTRDVPNYEDLMNSRIDALRANKISFSSILSEIAKLDPLPGAKTLLNELRTSLPVLILSDTFEQFAQIISPKLDHPTILCHRLIIENDEIVGFKLRLQDQKRATVEAFQRLNYNVVAIGDSFNDLAMLHAANTGLLMNPPENIKTTHPIFPSFDSLDDLSLHLKTILV